MLTLLLASSLALAEDKPAAPPAPTVKMGGVVFAHYGFDLSDGADGYNSFDLDRVYLTARGELTEHLATRVTLDADRIKPIDVAGTDVSVDTKTRVFVKHAYLEWKKVAPGVKLRFGMADTAWAPYYDTFWGYRFLAKSAADENKFVDTSDLGIQAMGEHAKGVVNWQVGIINGEGYGKVEVDASKTVQARITVDPLAPQKGMNLPINGFVSQSFGGDGDTITLYGGAVGFKMKYGVAWAEYLGRSSAGVSGQIISATLMPKIPDILTIVGRLDMVDPDTGAQGDATTKIIAGVGHEFFEKVTAVATFERQSLEGVDAASQGVFLRMQAGF